MKESDLNRIINKTFNKIGFSHKEPDPSGTEVTMTVKRPFDIFCVNNCFIAYIESKLLKGYKAFSFSLLREHQIEGLSKINSVVPKEIYGSYVYAVIAVGVWESRKFFDLYFFDISLILSLINLGKKSISKKELLKLKEDKKFNIIKGEFIVDSIEDIKNKIIFNIG